MTGSLAKDASLAPLSEKVLKEIKEKLASESDRDISLEDIVPTMSLRDDLGMDSMQAVSLSLDLEDAFSITLENDDLIQLNTVGDLMSVVQAKLSLREG
jgi:acyl carrier protein